MNDIVKLNGIIEKHFSETELSKISRLSTTNKCESLHHKVFTFAPKSTHKRIYATVSVVIRKARYDILNRVTSSVEK
jgi:hypothetical protein